MQKRNWAFDHDGHNWPTVIGMTEERSDEIIKTVRHELIDCDTLCYAAEAAFNKIQPQNEVEALYIGYVLGKANAMSQHGASPFAALAKLLGE